MSKNVQKIVSWIQSTSAARAARARAKAARTARLSAPAARQASSQATHVLPTALRGLTPIRPP